MSDYDGLKLCRVCGDRETQSDVCWVCRRQEAIDKYVPDFYVTCPQCGWLTDTVIDEAHKKYGCNVCGYEWGLG